MDTNLDELVAVTERYKKAALEFRQAEESLRNLLGPAAGSSAVLKPRPLARVFQAPKAPVASVGVPVAQRVRETLQAHPAGLSFTALVASLGPVSKWAVKAALKKARGNKDVRFNEDKKLYKWVAK